MTEHTLQSLESIKDGTSHSIYGPSGSSIWLECPGALIANALAPDDGNPDSAYGTTAHFVIETWRKTGKRPDHLVGTNMFVEAGEWGHLVWIDEEMMMYAEMNVDETNLIPGKHHIEQRVDISRITPIPNQGGRADFVSVMDDMIVVADDKMGINRVSAKNNTQAQLYALGCLWKFDPQGSKSHFLIRILQPRIDNFDEWMISRDDLLMFGGEARVKMKAAWQLDAPRKAGIHCTYCKVRGTCAARAKHELEMLEGVYENLDAPVTIGEMMDFKAHLEKDVNPIDVATLTTAQMAAVFPHRKASDRFWNALSIELMQRAISGDVEGYKVVQSRGTRRAWIDEQLAVARLAENGIDAATLYEKKLRSPAQAEKLLRAVGLTSKQLPEVIGDLVRQPLGKPTLVLTSDPRPALVDTSTVFEAIGDDDDDPDI